LRDKHLTWDHAGGLEPRSYTCGYCNNLVGSNQGYQHHNIAFRRVYICPFCGKPTYFDDDSQQYPGVSQGNQVDHLPEEIGKLYEEARRCVSVNSYTSSVLACRKLLMHLAVEEGADEGKAFIDYVKYLADNGYVPPGGENWVDLIRKKGNEANHVIKLMSKADSEQLLAFLEMLLKFMYEFPSRVTASEETAKTE